MRSGRSPGSSSGALRRWPSTRPMPGSWAPPVPPVTALGFLTLVFAALGWLTHHLHWEHTSNAVPGSHTSWTAILVLVWLTASQFDFGGGYHDARTVDAGGGSESLHVASRTLDPALTDWQTQVGEASESCVRNGRIPMVLIAAPGGGARAMYWTVAGMDQLFTTATRTPVETSPPSQPEESDPGARTAFCPQSLFAASGVSGGAVGLTTRLAEPPMKPATPTAVSLAGQAPLASTIASMLLRDLPQPSTGIRSRWRDRAAVLEDSWTEEADDVFTTTSEGDTAPLTLDQIGEDWWDQAGGPVLLLNGASVVDGCRVISGTIHQFAASRNGCLDAPAPAAKPSPTTAPSRPPPTFEPTSRPPRPRATPAKASSPTRFAMTTPSRVSLRSLARCSRSLPIPDAVWGAPQLQGPRR